MILFSDVQAFSNAQTCVHFPLGREEALRASEHDFVGFFPLHQLTSKRLGIGMNLDREVGISSRCLVSSTWFSQLFPY